MKHKITLLLLFSLPIVASDGNNTLVLERTFSFYRSPIITLADQPMHTVVFGTNNDSSSEVQEIQEVPMIFQHVGNQHPNQRINVNSMSFSGITVEDIPCCITDQETQTEEKRELISKGVQTEQQKEEQLSFCELITRLCCCDFN